ncbi:tRNA m(1)G methyltransferase Trm10 [Gorgonomyces haynaldii]|nr:tRNA m(1)G methyltransferase Trm10 [Gorgonomyces haynaldii]
MEQPLSKNAQKRLKREEKWAANAQERKDKRKEKRKEQRQRHQERKRQQPETVEKRLKPSEQVQSGIKVIIDMDFYDKMQPNEVKSLASQIGYCQKANKIVKKTIELQLSSFDTQWDQQFAHKYLNYRNTWNVQFSDLPLDQSSDRPLVYLTADSPNTLERLETDVTYVIGGIVDRNRYKELCLKKAQDLNIRHCKLPIGDYLQMASRKVLTVNHVFEIMVYYCNEPDWKKAFLKVIPERKGPIEVTKAKDPQEHSFAPDTVGNGQDPQASSQVEEKEDPAVCSAVEEKEDSVTEKIQDPKDE